MYKILSINLGSTSSKLAYFEDTTCIIKQNIEHPAEDLKKFPAILDQFDYRRKIIVEFLENHQIDYKNLDAIVSRGGHTHPIVSGTYKINNAMLSEIESGNYGRHACDIGVFIAESLSKEGKAIPMVVDPPVTDEFSPLARYSGLSELPRKSSFHALNHKAIAKQFAKDINADYNKLNLIVVHMGGGISVAAHQNGKMVDANNALNGDGPFSTNRAGTLPAGALVELCFSGKYTKEEIKAKINGKGGMMDYIGENDVKTVVEKALEGNTAYKECLDAMLYQTGKEIGSAASVLKGKVDAILFTGGIVFSDYVVNYLTEMIGYIGKIFVYPGESEMDSLTKGALAVLDGTEELKEI